MQWNDLCQVMRCHDNVIDYLIKSSGKVKLYHINMLKKYVRREKKDCSLKPVCQVCVVDDPDRSNDVCDVALIDEVRGG